MACGIALFHLHGQRLLADVIAAQDGLDFLQARSGVSWTFLR